MKFFDLKNLPHVFSLLPRGTSRKLLLLSAFQISVTVLDILAILLLGIITKSGLDYVQREVGEIPTQLVNLLNINSFAFEFQFGILSGIIFLLFTSRTAISIYGNRRILRFLGNQGASASNNLLERVFKSEPQYVVNKNSQEVLYGLTGGVDNLVLTYLGSLTLLLTETFFLCAILLVILIIQPLTGICALLIFGGTFWRIQKITSGQGKAISRDLGNLSISYNQSLLETLQIYRELVLRGGVSKATIDIRSKRRDSMSLRAQ